MLNIYVDGDACPVKDEAIRVATRYGLTLYIVSNQGARPRPEANVQIITVDKGFDAADHWIVEHIGANDVAITADIQLAARCLDKGAQALAPNGRLFTASNIGSALAMRALNQHLRETGDGKSYNPIFTKQDRSRFLQTLDGLMQKTK